MGLTFSIKEHWLVAYSVPGSVLGARPKVKFKGARSGLVLDGTVCNTGASAAGHVWSYREAGTRATLSLN